jgi:HEAT repeat protein
MLFTSAAPVSASAVSDIVAKMPAPDFAKGAPLIAEIIKAGPDGLKELCGMITPPDSVADAKARFALHGVVLYVKRPGAKAEAAMVEKALLGAMASAEQADVKQFFIHQIELCGSDLAVKPLGKLLGDKRLCEAATRALLRIRSDGAVAQIRAALAGAKDARLVTIVRALGQARDKASAKAIAKHAASDETSLRHSALFALANIGDPSAAGILAKASAATGNYERSVGMKYYLLLARRIGEGGDKGSCAKICRGVLATRTKPTDGNARCAALTVLADVLEGEAIDDVLAALDGKNVYVRDRAARILGGMKVSGASAKLVERFKTATPSTKVAIVGALGLSGDKDKGVIDALVAATGDKDKGVRIAAVGALAVAAPEKGIQAATAVMKSTDAEELAAAKSALLGVKAKGLPAAVAGAIDKASTEGKVTALQVLTARGGADQAKAVIVQLDSKEASVRQAAARAMGALAGAGDIAAILKKLTTTTDSREQAGLRSASISAIRRTGAGAKPVVKAMSGTSGARRAALLGVLSGIGGAEALALVVKDTVSSDKDTKEAAVRALASWPEMGAAAPLLSLAGKSDNATHCTLAIRGYIRLISLPSNRTAAQTVKLFAKALKAAPSPAEKKLIFGAMASVRTVEALALAMKYVDDPALREEAAMAAVKIACPTGRRQRLLKGPEVRKNLEKIIAVAKNKWTRDTARKYAGKK